MADGKDLGQFMGRDLSFGAVHQKDHIKSFIDGDAGVLQDGACDNRFFVTAFRTTPAVR